jgi:hypothetical protein
LGLANAVTSEADDDVALRFGSTSGAGGNGGGEDGVAPLEAAACLAADGLRDLTTVDPVLESLCLAAGPADPASTGDVRAIERLLATDFRAAVLFRTDARRLLGPARGVAVISSAWTLCTLVIARRRPVLVVGRASTGDAEESKSSTGISISATPASVSV